MPIPEMNKKTVAQRLDKSFFKKDSAEKYLFSGFLKFIAKSDF
jgi:hypothetical protein